LYRFPSYKKALYKTFYQLSHYGKEDISVLISILESLQVTADVVPNRHHIELWEIHGYVLEGVDIQGLKTLDIEKLQEKVDVLAVATGQHSYNLRLVEQ
ncbi:MAG: DUF2254 domain-containing protein, partial [Planococcus donghaensis]